MEPIHRDTIASEYMSRKSVADLIALHLGFTIAILIFSIICIIGAANIKREISDIKESITNF